MLNYELKLNPKIFNTDVENKSCRDGFGQGLLKIGIDNDKVYGLSADLSSSTRMNLFAEKFPDRYIEVGVAEQNLASVASGLASMGKIPFISSFAIFSPGRNWEQIRTTICYNNQPVKIIGSHAGLSAGPDGGSHQALEDIALTTVLPNMVVLSPCDYYQAYKSTLASVLSDSPVYIRIDRNDNYQITTQETPFQIGKAELIYLPDKAIADIGIIATGPILYNAIISAYELEKIGIKVKVLNLSTIKPLDIESVVSLAKETKAILTIEEHQIIGGLGSMVAQCLAENYPVPIEFIGIDDKFGQSGTIKELHEYYGLDIKSIKEKVNLLIHRKNKFCH